MLAGDCAEEAVFCIVRCAETSADEVNDENLALPQVSGNVPSAGQARGPDREHKRN
jgi:hypothetical protein